MVLLPSLRHFSLSDVFTPVLSSFLHLSTVWLLSPLLLWMPVSWCFLFDIIGALVQVPSYHHSSCLSSSMYMRMRSLTSFLYYASFHDPLPTIWLFLLSSIGSELNRGNFCGCWIFISYCLRCPFRYLSLHPFSVSPAYYQPCNNVISSVLNCPFSNMSLRTPLWSSAHYHLRKLAVCFLLVLSVIRTNVLWHWSPAHYQLC